LPSLHDLGWRQGFLVTASLTAQVYTIEDGVQRTSELVHGLWLLAEQDCDLAQTDVGDIAKQFELRAVRYHEGDIPRGITGGRMRINATQCVHALDIVTKVTATWLAANFENAISVDPETRREVKTWMGYRYDRPAVPAAISKIHTRIQKLAKFARTEPQQNVAQKNWSRLDLGKVRDLLVGYEETAGQGKVRANLYAIAKEERDVVELQAWVERIRDAVEDTEPFIVFMVDARDPDNTPISLLETAYSVYGDSHSLTKAADDVEDGGGGGRGTAA
jgi:hypothetical protein